MQLYLVRHAVAADVEPGQTDADRPLSREGAERFGQGVEALRRMGVRFERLLHSPLARAEQTARLLQPLLLGPVQASEHLVDEPSPALLEELAKTGQGAPRAGARVAVVGHEPWLSQLAAWLSTSSPANSRSLELDKGSLIWLQGEPVPGGMVVRALFPLDSLVRLTS